MPDTIQTIKAVAEAGLGVASFIAMVFGVWYFGNKLVDRVAEKLDEIRTNHLPHLQNGVDELNKKTDKTNELLEKLVNK